MFVSVSQWPNQCFQIACVQSTVQNPKNEKFSKPSSFAWKTETMNRLSKQFATNFLSTDWSTKHLCPNRLSTYFKFFIVRDPFERLISAFKDKFVKNPRFEPWYKHDIAPAIIRKYRKSHRDSDHSASGLHFEDFVRYLGDVEGRRRMDRQFGEHIIHWVTYADLCAPCEIHYSAVGHHETLEQDAPYILKAAGIDQLVSYPAIPPGITRYNRTKVEHYFSGISKRDVRRLYARYQGDFQLFGYPSPDFLLN